MLPVSYIESRKQFIEIARSLGAAIERYDLDADKGSAPGLSTDVALLGPAGAPNIVVVSSGTHGVEGYCGTACQLYFMRRYESDFARADTAYLLVHAVNPWGYFQDRRTTEEGIDLNRNFIDFPCSMPSSAYREHHDMLVANFRRLPAGLGNELRLLSSAVTRKRRRALQEAISTGQDDRPDGLFFRGTGPARSRLVWETILRTRMAGRRRAALLDIHTGLGRYGEGELLSYLPASSPAFGRMNEWFGDLKSLVAGDSVSAAVNGTLTAGFDRSVPCESFAVGLEFGTRAPIAVLYALRADQWYRNNAARLTTADREWARQKMRNAFRIADPRWHDKVIARFDQVMQQLVAGINRA
ncbi:MAG: hypothetical protein JWR25_1550 [Noviherbaspirillum sp.]|nr:hypothetical protein [Noviherbaspirillum sp.]